MFIIQRTTYSNARIVCVACHSIYVGEQGITEFYSLAHQREILKFPYTPLNTAVLCGMSAEDWRKHSKLNPAQHKFRIVYGFVISKGMASKVVPPISIAHIRCCCGEIWLKGKSRKIDKRIAREPYLITVTAQASPTVENHRTAVGTVVCHIIIEHMIAPECLTESCCIRACKVLLPVYPPEVNALFLVATDNPVEKRLCEIGIVQAPCYSVVLYILTAKVGGHLSEISRRLIPVYSVGRMQVKGNLELLGVNVAEQLLRIGNKVGVPRPARPSSNPCRLTVGIAIPVPVHVENHHVGRNVVIGKILHYLTVVGSRVRLVLAVPISKDVGRRQWYFAGNLCKVAQSFLIVGAIPHEIGVHGT